MMWSPLLATGAEPAARGELGELIDPVLQILNLGVLHAPSGLISIGSGMPLPSPVTISGTFPVMHR